MCASKLTKIVFLLLIAMNGASNPSEAPFIFRNFGKTLLNADNVIIGSKYGKLLFHTFYIQFAPTYLDFIAKTMHSGHLSS